MLCFYNQKNSRSSKKRSLVSCRVSVHVAAQGAGSGRGRGKGGRRASGSFWDHGMLACLRETDLMFIVFKEQL